MTDPSLLWRTDRAIRTRQNNPSFAELDDAQRSGYTQDILYSEEMAEIGTMPATLIVLAEDGAEPDRKRAEKAKKAVRQRAAQLRATTAPTVGKSGPQNAPG